MRVYDAQLRWLGYTRLTSLGSAVTFGTIPAGTKYVLIKPETQGVRILSGSNPTTTNGLLIDVGDEFFLPIADQAAMRIIEVAASAACSLVFLG